MGVRGAINIAALGGPGAAMELVTNVLESSTEYSIIAADLDGTIVLWNEGGRQIYGFEPDEVVGIVNVEALYAPPSRETDEPGRSWRKALVDGKWEDTVEQVRKSGERMMARVVVTP